MSYSEKTLDCYVIAGSNGSGKSTFAEEFLPDFVHCRNFINADLIAKGLSPFDPEKAKIKAGRLVYDQINSYIKYGESFSLETTLAGRIYLKIFEKLRTHQYRIHLFYLWIPSTELAVKRIDDRVKQGGHFVSEEDVKRRFTRSLNNFFNLYRPILDSILFFDNSQNIPKLIFEESENDLTIYDDVLYNQILKETVNGQ